LFRKKLLGSFASFPFASLACHPLLSTFSLHLLRGTFLETQLTDILPSDLPPPQEMASGVRCKAQGVKRKQKKHLSKFFWAAFRSSRDAIAGIGSSFSFLHFIYA
jgi:hypothetical protein